MFFVHKKSRFPHGDLPNVPTRPKLSAIPILFGTFGFHQDIKAIPSCTPHTQTTSTQISHISCYFFMKYRCIFKD